MKILFKTSEIVYKNKRQFVFYSIIDNQKKKNIAIDLCKQFIKSNYTLIQNKRLDNQYIYPELKESDFLLIYNKLSHDKFQQVVTGKYFEEDYLRVFSSNPQLIYNKEKVSLSKHIDELTTKTIDPNYENTYIYSNFKEFSNFLSKFGKNQENKEKVETFIKCLCHINLGNVIHNQIKNEISKKTNFYILKGDYFFSLGYYNISKLGNSLLIKFYSKIAENFASSNFYLDISKINNKNYYNFFINYLVKKYIGNIYFGCLGIKELLLRENSHQINQILKEFSFNYGLLLYLKEELSMLKNKTYEYFTKIEEYLNLFIFIIEGIGKFSKNSINSLKTTIGELLNDKNYLKKYEILAISLCSHLFELIDEINTEKKDINVEGIKDHIRTIYQEIEFLVLI